MEHRAGIKKEYYDAVLFTLKSYHILEETRNRLEEELNELKGNVKIKGISYDQIRVQTSGINKSTERDALWNVEDEKELLLQILECDHKMKIINDAIDQLDEHYGVVIRLKYIENLCWFDIQDKLFIAERTGHHRSSKGMEDLAYLFYGDRALVGIEIAS
jgi:hypothetical protein